MKKVLTGSLLLLLSFVFALEAWMYWDGLAKPVALAVGAAIGGCLTAGLFVLLWRPAHPATRYSANLPSPYDRRTWR